MPIISRTQSKAKETRPHRCWDGYSKRAECQALVGTHIPGRLHGQLPWQCVAVPCDTHSCHSTQVLTRGRWKHVAMDPAHKPHGHLSVIAPSAHLPRETLLGHKMVTLKALMLSKWVRQSPGFPLSKILSANICSDRAGQWLPRNGGAEWGACQGADSAFTSCLRRWFQGWTRRLKLLKFCVSNMCNFTHYYV